MHCGTAVCVPEAVPCIQLCSLNSKTCKNSAYIHKIKIKCCKSDVCRFPPYMAYVLHRGVFWDNKVSCS